MAPASFLHELLMLLPVSPRSHALQQQLLATAAPVFFKSKSSSWNPCMSPPPHELGPSVRDANGAGRSRLGGRARDATMRTSRLLPLGLLLATQCSPAHTMGTNELGFARSGQARAPRCRAIAIPRGLRQAATHVLWGVWVLGRRNCMFAPPRSWTARLLHGPCSRPIAVQKMEAVRARADPGLCGARGAAPPAVPPTG